MEPPPTADQPGPSFPIVNNHSLSSYAEKLKGSTCPQELAVRAAKKAFVHGVDTKIIGSSAVVNGRKTIFLSKEEDEFMVAPFQYALVGKLFDPNNYARIWMKQTWYFDGFPMRVLKWTADFDPTQESPIMPIWIKIFGLKPHWFHRQFLYHVASLIGKPLKLDEATTEIDNPVAARICVEINVLDKLTPDIPIQIDGQTRLCKVQYEGIPEYCRVCRHRGHTIAACYARKEKDDSGEKLNNEEPINNNEEDMSTPSLGLAEPPNGVLMRKSNKDVIIPLNKVHEQMTHRGSDDFSCQGLKDVNVSSSKEGAVRSQGVTNMEQDGSVNEQEPKNTSNIVQKSSKTDQEVTTSDQDQSIEVLESQHHTLFVKHSSINDQENPRTDQVKFDGDQVKVGKTQKKPKVVQEKHKINRDCRVVSYATQKGRPRLNSINMASTKIGEREAMDDDAWEDDGEGNNQPLAIGYDVEIPNSGEMEEESDDTTYIE
ncbi:hypothetical protein BUALT_Bualt01G0050600 [Buddleja alternifolia]|uniref:DUF4283 domain-containing protein n=1 Tax=Buddleja alternifolia TaxID=168488 RepID=A0AAV6YB77_9LAMI|nr:hypothetical protein BUALT_Bualt01G0050600 [Buddleja alternifolia]